MRSRLILSPIAILIRPKSAFKELYNSAPIVFAFSWYFIVIIGGSLLFSWFESTNEPFRLSWQNLLDYFSWPPLGTAMIALYTICACYLLLYLEKDIIEQSGITHAFWISGGILTLFSLTLIGRMDLLELVNEVVTPTDPILQINIALLVAVGLTAVAFSTSLYVAAGDWEASHVMKRHILGTCSGIILVAGTLFLIHKLVLLGLPVVVRPEIVFPAKVAITGLVVLLFTGYVGVLLEVNTMHAQQSGRSGLLMIIAFNFLNILSHLLAASLVWILASAVYRGMSGSGALPAKVLGGVLAVLVAIGIGLILFLTIYFTLYEKDALLHKLFWKVRLETLLLDPSVLQLETFSQIRDLFETVLKETKSFASARVRMIDQLTAFLDSLYSSHPDRAMDLVAQLPSYTYDANVWLPILKHVLSKQKQVVATEQIFSRLHSSGLLERVGTKLKSIPLLYSYYNLWAVKEGRLESALRQVTKEYRQLSEAGNLLRIYEELIKYDSVSTFKDIVNLSLIGTTQIDFTHNTTSYLEKPFKSFQTIISNVRKSEKVALEHKLPYFADSFEVFNVITSAASRLPQPHQHVFTLIARQWQSILTAELMSLKGRAEIKVALRLRKFYTWDKLTIPIEIQNTGNSVAEDIRIQLIADEGQFKVLDFDFNEIDILSPGKSIVVNFNIATECKGKIRIAIETTFTDFDAPNKTHKFGDVIEVTDKEEEIPEATISYTAFMANPYIPGRPIREQEMFFGRQDVIATIEQSLVGRHQDNVIVLQGERRSGKTSILYYLLNRLKDEYVPVLVDAQGILSRGTEYFLWQIASIIQQQLQDRGFEVPVPDREVAAQDAEIWLRRDFLSSVRAALNGQRLLILFDEFDSLEDRIREGALDKEIFPFFRSLMQHEDWLAFVFSGTYRLEEMVTEYWSILFNIAIYIRLGFLSETDARLLITKPVTGQLEYDEFAIERILVVTSAHPYFVQLMCFLLYNLHVREGKTYITSQDVDRIIDDVIDTQAHTHFIWKDTSRQEHFVLAAVGQEAKQENDVVTPVMVRSALNAHQITLSQSDVNDALAKLTRKGIISSDSTNTQFSFRVELIRRWLRRYKSLSSVIEESGR